MNLPLAYKTEFDENTLTYNTMVSTERDVLTGLFNRSGFLRQLKIQFESTDSCGSCAVIILDIDQFRFINQQFGSEIGDMLLQDIGREIVLILGCQDICARLSGDKFGLCLYDVPDLEYVKAVGYRIQHMLSKSRHIKDKDLVLSVAIGIHYLDDFTKHEINLAFHAAEKALYRAKNIGRGEIQIFDDNCSGRYRRPEKEAELLRGMRENELTLYYQPIISFIERKVVGFESLVRWEKDNKVYEPVHFLGLAEENGSILILGQQLIFKAVKTLAKWRDQDMDIEKIYISINATAKQFQQSELAKYIADALQKYDVPAHCLVIELTESAFLEENEQVIKNFEGLQALGVRIYLDDFGTGYSSLSYLARFPVDGLKIDRSFVAKLGKSQAVDSIVKMILSLAKGLDIPVIAEGIEDKSQELHLRKLGAEYAQGFLWAKALPEKQALYVLRKYAN